MIINGTMDSLHVKTTIPLLKAGYHVLLEKPFAINEAEMWELYKANQRYQRHVNICHVLRYAPFYAAIKKKVMEGEIGDIINIQLTEHVSYHHLMAAFVRGKWGNQYVCGAPMLLAKCCHDMDLMMWLMDQDEPVQVASFGSDFQFAPEKTPPRAGTRCTVDCPIEAECPQSAKKYFLDYPERWKAYAWECLEYLGEPTLEDKIKSIATDNPYGLCAWKCNHDNVDHQSVLVNFASGATCTLNMIGGSPAGERKIHIIGTKGDIYGTFDTSKFVIRKIVQTYPQNFSSETVDVKETGDMTGLTGGHGGGDLRLALDYVNLLQGEKPSYSCTSLEDSIKSHLAVFCAEEARKESKVVSLRERFHMNQ